LIDAAEAVDAALSTQPDYPTALLARGRVLLAQSRSSDAVVVLRRAARFNPLPEYQWALADALRLNRLDSEADGVEHDLIERGAQTDPRTLALFLATRRTSSETALALTEGELLVRGDVFTQDARAWALAAAGRTDEARAAMRLALAENTRDARLYLHAGVIAWAAGHRADARRWLARADALRATLLPSERDELHRSEIARTYTNRGE
jgi:tetratricopeptide (TPR) repeat protein